MMESGFARIRRFENAHILLWLLKDLCWAAEYKTGGLLMIIPTVLVAVYLMWQSRTNRIELVHNVAVCLWISANSTWMIGEFYFENSTKPLAMVFFTLGLLVLLLHYMSTWIQRRNASRTP